MSTVHSNADYDRLEHGNGRGRFSDSGANCSMAISSRISGQHLGDDVGKVATKDRIWSLADRWWENA